MTGEVSQIPLGFCQCGCGAQTNLASTTISSRGWIKGQPLRYIKGHSSRNIDPRKRWTVEDRGYSTACHIHVGCFNDNGYGMQHRDYKTHAAHRLAWIDANGPIPEGIKVLHHCDVPACRNVEHLFLGTSADNTADMVSKRRHCHRENHPRAKLTEQDIIEIRCSSGTHDQIAEKYGVGRTTITKIINYQTWKELNPLVSTDEVSYFQGQSTSVASFLLRYRHDSSEV